MGKCGDGANKVVGSKQTATASTAPNSTADQTDEDACEKEIEKFLSEDSAATPTVIKQESKIDVSLQSITFNAGKTHSVYLRKNYGETINIPEWTNDDPSVLSYAAYIIKGMPAQNDLKVVFKVKDVLNISNLCVKGNCQDPLSDSEETQCQLPSSTFSEEKELPVDMPFAKHQLNGKGVQKYEFSIQWTYQKNNEKNWIPIQTTQHVVYMILETPKSPWISKAADDSQQPWTEALDIACAWAKGEKDLRGVATAVTTQINQAPNLAYDVDGGASFFTRGYITNRNTAAYDFLCTEFIYKISKKSITFLNCTDCATICSTFSNILGCNLEQVVFGRRQSNGRFVGFHCNKIIAIGSTSFHITFETRGFDSFSYHEIAFDKNSYTGMTPKIGNVIYDACLKVRGDSTPWSNSTLNVKAILPVNMIFAKYDSSAYSPLTVFTELNYYRERLVQNDYNNMYNADIDTLIGENRKVW